MAKDKLFKIDKKTLGIAALAAGALYLYSTRNKPSPPYYNPQAYRPPVNNSGTTAAAITTGADVATRLLDILWGGRSDSSGSGYDASGQSYVSGRRPRKLE